MKLTVKGLKKFQTDDGYAFRCTVVVDGGASFVASNDGNGGPNLYDGDRAVIAAAMEWANTQPPITVDFGTGPHALEYDLDLAVEDAINAEMDRQWLVRQCKGKTVFRMPDSKPGEWLVIKAPFTAEIRAHVLAKHPDAVFGNDLVLQAA